MLNKKLLLIKIDNTIKMKDKSILLLFRNYLEKKK